MGSKLSVSEYKHQNGPRQLTNSCPQKSLKPLKNGEEKTVKLDVFQKIHI